MMKIIKIHPRAYGSNGYLVVSGKQAIFIDPGSNAPEILRRIKESGALLTYIFLTHAHFDHMIALRAVLQACQAPVCLHESEADFPGDPLKNASFLVFNEESYPAPDRLLSDRESFSFGEETLTVLHTPGHTQGSCCFLVGKHLFTGDTLFADGVGRTDLFSGDDDRQAASLKFLKTLPGDLVIHPGHGDDEILSKALARI